MNDILVEAVESFWITTLKYLGAYKLVYRVPIVVFESLSTSVPVVDVHVNLHVQETCPPIFEYTTSLVNPTRVRPNIRKLPVVKIPKAILELAVEIAVSTYVLLVVWFAAVAIAQLTVPEKTALAPPPLSTYLVRPWIRLPLSSLREYWAPAALICKLYYCVSFFRCR